MTYVVLRSRLKKQLKNQKAHVLDENGRTYCQTENVKRKAPFRFLVIDHSGGRQICQACIEVQRLRENKEPRLSVLMGETIE